MKKALNATLLLGLSFSGSLSYAACSLISGGSASSPDFVSEFQQNMTSPEIYSHINIKCSGRSSPITWYTERSDPNGWQQKVDLLLDDLEANPRLVGGYVKIFKARSSGAPIAEMHFDFGKKGGVVTHQNTTTTNLKSGQYEVVVGSHPIIHSPKRPTYGLSRSDKRLLVNIGGLPITYAIDFKADPTIPICNPKYKYYVDRTNIMFDTSSSDFFNKGGSLHQDIILKLERVNDPNCNAEIMFPLIKIHSPMGPDVETTGIIGKNIAPLKNGTSLALYQFRNGTNESPMNYGLSYALEIMGTGHSFQSSRKIRVKWEKTPGKSVKTGHWRATMKYEFYFQ